MFFPFVRSFILPLTVCSFATLASSSRACGPDFPNAYLVASADELTGLPTLSFPAELARLLPPGTALPRFAPPANDASFSTAELAEAREVLAPQLSRRKLEVTLAAYTREDPPALLPQEFHLYAAGAQAWHADRISEALGAWRELLTLPAAQRHYRTVWAQYMIGRALWDSDEKIAREAFQAAAPRPAPVLPTAKGWQRPA